MWKKMLLSGLIGVVVAVGGTKAEAQGGHGSVLPMEKPVIMPEKGMNPIRPEPPPQAYTDCVGKKAGDAVQHTTPEGKVAATCMESPKGLVARPNRPPAGSPR